MLLFTTLGDRSNFVRDEIIPICTLEALELCAQGYNVANCRALKSPLEFAMCETPRLNKDVRWTLE